ncbi:unnamed protein product [Durusdinium trenchii]|uniref:Biogenesis of lysosome-related organelles complex 1 subunit 1 n=1 Tax=Durusdinium trenchii TaxID=1381693 RepID=A0ABP0MR86_9DINO
MDNVQHCHAWQEDGGPSLGPVDAKGAELMQTRARAMSGAAVAATSEAARAKEVFAKHVESVLAKAAKIRAVVQLNADLNVLDGEYNKLSEHVAQGERDDHNQA